MEFKLEEFLQLFPDPVTHFYDETKPVSETYKQHAQVSAGDAFDGWSLNA